MINADFESILSEDNGKQDSEEPYTIKYQKLIASSYGHKLVCVLMTGLVSLLRHTQAEMLFTIFLIV